MLLSLVDTNLNKVKIAERQCSIFLLLQMMSNVVENAWPGSRLSARLLHINACTTSEVCPQSFVCFVFSSDFCLLVRKVAKWQVAENSTSRLINLEIAISPSFPFSRLRE